MVRGELNQAERAVLAQIDAALAVPFVCPVTIVGQQVSRAEARAIERRLYRRALERRLLRGPHVFNSSHGGNNG